MKSFFSALLFKFTLLIILIVINGETSVKRKCRLGTRIPHPFDCGKYMVKKTSFFHINNNVTLRLLNEALKKIHTNSNP